jgi:dTDP-4-amino-4,6-dideoxygalactose transaminase
MSAARLAIAGGQACVDPAAHRRWPEITETDRRAVDRVLERGVMAGPNAPELRALEEEYADRVGVKYCVATNTGTASLHAALAAVGAGPGGEVIVPAYTFVSSAFVAIYQGASVVFCDVDPGTYNLDASRLESLITERTQAIMAVHVHGQPADMDDIAGIAARHGVPVVEDNSQAHGITYKGRTTGSIGAAAGASINWSKNLPSAEGGLFTTNDEEHALVARRMVLYGEDVLPDAPRAYWSHGLGWNNRGQEMVCALARGQLRRLDGYNARAQENAARLTDGLAGLKGIETPRVNSGRGCSYWRYQVQVRPDELGFDGDPRDLRDRIMGALNAEGVAVCVWQPQPVPAQPAFRRRMQVWRPDTEAERPRPWESAQFPAASRLCDISLSLGSIWKPLYVQEPGLMDRYAHAVRKVMADLDTVLSVPMEPYPRMTDAPC